MRRPQMPSTTIRRPMFPVVWCAPDVTTIMRGSNGPQMTVANVHISDSFLSPLQFSFTGLDFHYPIQSQTKLLNPRKTRLIHIMMSLPHQLTRTSNSSTIPASTISTPHILRSHT